MEKRWLGSIGLILVLVLLVFAVGYSSGNSVTGYQFFNIFKKEPNLISPAERESLPMASSRCCTLTYLGLDDLGRAVVDVNGRTVFIDEENSGLVNGCRVQFHQASRGGMNARFNFEDELYTLDPNDQFSAGDCRDASCCTMLFVGVNRGQAIVEVNGQNAFLRRGQRQDINNCNVELLSMSGDGMNTRFRLQGDEVILDPRDVSSEGSSCDPCAGFNTL